MNPVKFPECNAVYGEGQPDYKPLPAYRSPGGEVVTCWELTEEEKKRVAETGQIWLSLLTFGLPLQPVYITTDPAELLTTRQEGEPVK